MRPRGRPKKYRRVGIAPRISYFSPRGKPGRPDEINLLVEEFEAIRLSDFLGLDQREAAKLMHISQQTFSRMLKRGRKAVAEALISGKIIRIQGGHYVVTTRQESA